MDEEEILFDALEGPMPTDGEERRDNKDIGSPHGDVADSLVCVVSVSRKELPPSSAKIYESQILQLSEQVHSLKASAASYNASRAEATATNAMLQKQLEHQHSMVKHLKQMLKNLSDKYTATQLEMKAFKVHAQDTQAALESSTEQLWHATAAIDSFKRQETTWQETLQRCTALENRLVHVEDECSEWKAEAEMLRGMRDENDRLKDDIAAMAQDQAIAAKRTHHMIKELRQSLKEEQDKQAATTPTTPAAPPAVLDPAADALNGIVRDMAARIEQLLTQNAALVERIQFSQENVQLLAEDLERKRVIIQQLTLGLHVTKDEQRDILALAITTAAALESTASCESLLYVTLKENLLLKKQLGCHAPYAVSWREPDGAAFYRAM
ncbi:Aste57867_3505 [Aphanomyces stellatus]|uniref:Aste57867_3505 protein n=1 Tax=Aphanomyces stellatus TaxID=120398 RepID=A0A485K9U0_9STRA|nr:hypothetical protein As57867_003494 [Aphanomyces stellatus]VFT80668.1 Aste57867_3505 [Aphanomyces stellatus]